MYVFLLRLLFVNYYTAVYLNGAKAKAQLQRPKRRNAACLWENERQGKNILSGKQGKKCVSQPQNSISESVKKP
jgi:hypothetical protein